MIILPAIDIKDRTPVRLYQGAFDTVHQVAADALETARSFEAAGAEWIHMVDLDGACEGRPVNTDIFLSVAKETGLKVELGGGIRTMEDIDSYLSAGISRVILGSVALHEPALVRAAVEKYGEKIAVGIDAKGGRVRGGGWLEESDVYFVDLAKAMAAVGVQTIIYTDIAKDGTLSGPTLADYEALIAACPQLHTIASGGIRDVSNIVALKACGCYGAICGKSLYEGTLSLEEALAAAKEA
ncbi:MAG: 1-(5-phosphoribosyl)-5-[(5-phosphoribosylamino)methylideneamino]imidazole-4-carboxamide isomerase [Peptococcaceae bacterium]|nr:1-(5-phosphoribosyl)-5-[(5-phosphoribosylamino)methylideneamino]imidazole-4-carboxamide isomerase [Peptococcaceae bacterium]